MSIQGMRGIFRRLSYNAALSANVHRRDINHWFFFHYYLLFACYGTFRFSINIFFFQKKGGTKLYICIWIKNIGHSLKTVPKKNVVWKELSAGYDFLWLNIEEGIKYYSARKFSDILSTWQFQIHIYIHIIYIIAQSSWTGPVSCKIRTFLNWIDEIFNKANCFQSFIDFAPCWFSVKPSVDLYFIIKVYSVLGKCRLHVTLRQEVASAQGVYNIENR